MAAPGNPAWLKSKRGGKGSEHKAVPEPIHGHKHGKDQLGHGHGPNTELHHTH